ncbi:MAG: site-specific DNA-methyltransferase [Bacillota bacterium]
MSEEFPKVATEIFNPVNENIKKLADLFPEAVKDGQLDFEALKQELGQFEKAGVEKYELNWPGKTQAKQIASMDISGRTLKYVPEDSKNADTTENIYIEGDNLEVLKLLRNSYYGQIKMIYIDPPYNTGKDFVYKDKFASTTDEYDRKLGSIDGEDNRLVKNTKDDGKYHSNWLNMMYPRLKIAKDLLKVEGLIFISIDENEHPRLRNICDEIFGCDNHLVDFVWQNKKGGGNDSIHVAIEHEYITVYAKNKELVDEFYEMYTDNYLTRYNLEDEDGKYFWDTFKRKSGKQYYPIVCPDGSVLRVDVDGNPISWLRSENRFKEDLIKGDVRIIQVKGYWTVHFKQRLPKGKKPRSIFSVDTLFDKHGTTSSGSRRLLELFGKDVFSNPKPVELLESLFYFTLLDDEIVLDFFSGSGTIGDAVFKINAEQQTSRKFIAVQIEENLVEMLNNTEASKRVIIENAIEVLSGREMQLNLAELGKERIRRAGEKIKKDNADKPSIADLDIGFKVFRVADSNIRWTKEMNNLDLEELAAYSNEKDKLDFMPEFTDVDVVYEILLRHRDFPLTSKIEQLKAIGKRTYMFADAVVVCLEENIDDGVVDIIAALMPQPVKVIFRDSAFEEQISLKLNTMHRLNAQMERHSVANKREKTWRVEFI